MVTATRYSISMLFVIVTLVIGGLLAALWQTQQPRLYRLQVVNNSDLMIDQVQVMGSALVASNRLVSVAPGEKGLLEVQLSGDGQLRFEVVQQGTKIDMLVVKNGSPAHWVQSLSVENQRRFLLSEGLLQQ